MITSNPDALTRQDALVAARNRCPWVIEKTERPTTRTFAIWRLITCCQILKDAQYRAALFQPLPNEFSLY